MRRSSEKILTQVNERTWSQLIKMPSGGTALILHFGTRCQKHRLNGSSCWSDFLMKIRSTGHLFEYLPFCKRLKPAISDRSVLQHKSCHLQLDFCCHAPPHTQGVGGYKNVTVFVHIWSEPKPCTRREGNKKPMPSKWSLY